MQFTKEQIEKAAACKSSDELLTLADSQGISLTKDEADKYFQQLSGVALSADDIEGVAGGCASHLCGADACANLC
jgi:hypothetical protein